jgi:predicted transcriptional regulator
MDVVYELEQASVAQVLSRIPDPPSYSAVRAMLRLLEDKGHLKHKHDGPRYIYQATVPRSRARQSALKRLLRTFFAGSTEAAVATLLDMESSKLSPDELDRLAELIERARREGR